MAARLNLLAIRSADPAAAAAFYEILGLHFHHHAHGAGPMHYSSDDPSVIFEIYPLCPRETPTASTRFGFQVSALDETLPALLAAGGRLVCAPKPSSWGYRAVIEDLDGHRIELTSLVAEQQSPAGPEEMQSP